MYFNLLCSYGLFFLQFHRLSYPTKKKMMIFCSVGLLFQFFDMVSNAYWMSEVHWKLIPYDVYIIWYEFIHSFIQFLVSVLISVLAY